MTLPAAAASSRLAPEVCVALAALVVGVGVGAGIAADGGALLPLAVGGAGALLAVALAARLHLGRAPARRGGARIAALLLSLHCIGLDFGPLNALNAATAALLALWLLERLHEPRADAPGALFAALVLGFGAAILLSALDQPSGAGAGLLRTLPKLAAALLLLELLREPECVRLGIRWLVLGAAPFAVLGVAQAALFYGWGVDLRLPEVRELGYVYTAAGTALLRVSGLCSNAHSFGETMLTPALIALQLLAARAWPTRTRALALTLVLALLGLALSVARAQWLAFALGLAVLPLIARPDRALHWISLLVLVLVAALASGLLSIAAAPLVELVQQDDGVRRTLLAAGVRALASQPLNGVGVGGVAEAAVGMERWDVHNSLLQVGSELGIPGLLAFAAVLVWVGVRLHRARRAAVDPTQRAELTALLGGYVGLLVEMQFHPFAYNPYIWAYLALSEAAARCAGRERSSC